MKRELDQLFEALGGPSAVARLLNEARISITPWAVSKWQRNGRLPRTEYTGETDYLSVLVAECMARDPKTSITREAILKRPAARKDQVLGVV